MVRKAGFEPARPKAVPFESTVSAIPPLSLEPTPRIELGPNPYQGFILPLNYAGESNFCRSLATNSRFLSWYSRSLNNVGSSFSASHRCFNSFQSRSISCFIGAGEGNRTPIVAMATRCFTIKLRPHGVVEPEGFEPSMPPCKGGVIPFHQGPNCDDDIFAW